MWSCRVSVSCRLMNDCEQEACKPETPWWRAEHLPDICGSILFSFCTKSRCLSLILSTYMFFKLIFCRLVPLNDHHTSAGLRGLFIFFACWNWNLLPISPPTSTSTGSDVRYISGLFGINLNQSILILEECWSTFFFLLFVVPVFYHEV